MTKPRRLLAVCATICLVFVLALVVGATAYHGSVSKTSGSSGKFVADGGPPPYDDDSDVGNVKIADGGPPPYDDDSDVGNVKLADGGPPPYDDDSDVGNVKLASVGTSASSLLQ
jgi:hypothetical protein